MKEIMDKQHKPYTMHTTNFSYYQGIAEKFVILYYVLISMSERVGGGGSRGETPSIAGNNNLEIIILGS